jgi:two-component system sensor histidine kinase HydH
MSGPLLASPQMVWLQGGAAAWAWVLAAGAGLAGFLWGRRRGSGATPACRPPAHQAAHPAEEPFSLVTVISGLAHELRNPLSNLKLNLQLLREDLAAILVEQADNPSHRRILNRFETAAGEAGRLERTLEQFLQFASNPRPELRRVEVNGLIGELLDFFMPQAATHRIRVHATLGVKPLQTLLDPVLFKQALLNLLINAQQAMPAGGELILRTAADPQDRRVRIDVIDTGPGIPPDQIDKIFLAYYSTKKGGTGLGLSISSRIVQAHSGTLTVRSEVGKGSDFCIELPLDKSVPGEST